MRAMTIKRHAVAVERNGISGLVQTMSGASPELFEHKQHAALLKRNVAPDFKGSKLRVVKVTATFQWE